MIKLCYQSYDYKADLGALKAFKKDTKEDLLFILSGVLECWADTKGQPQRSRINAIYGVADFECAAYIFFHLIKRSGKNIPFAEVEDAMFRVGVSPNAIDDEYCLPWPIVLLKVAQDIEEDFQESLPQLKKKLGTSE